MTTKQDKIKYKSLTDVYFQGKTPILYWKEAEAKARADERKKVLERVIIDLDSIVNAHLWGDYGLSKGDVYTDCKAYLKKLKNYDQVQPPILERQKPSPML